MDYLLCSPSSFSRNKKSGSSGCCKSYPGSAVLQCDTETSCRPSAALSCDCGNTASDSAFVGLLFSFRPYRSSICCCVRFIFYEKPSVDSGTDFICADRIYAALSLCALSVGRACGSASRNFVRLDREYAGEKTGQEERISAEPGLAGT